MKKLIFLFSTLCFISCARGPLKSPGEALRLTQAPLDLSDKESVESLQTAFKKLLAVYDTAPNIAREFRFGERTISREEYKAALQAASNQTSDLAAFSNFIRANFEFYEVYGSSDGWADVLSTGYYAPLLQGSYKKTKQFTRPLYKTPEDLVTIDIVAFAEKNPGLEWLQRILPPPPNKRPVMRGQLISSTTGPMVVPYLERKQIDVLTGVGPLSGKKLEIVWVNPVDAFYLQIQGSGIVEVGKERFLVGYDKQNGYAWFPIGRALTHIIPLEQMSMQRVRAYLATLTPEQTQEVLNQDPSYVFFKKLTGSPIGYSGAEVVGQRTIATDAGLFAKGTLAFFDIELPIFTADAQVDPAAWEKRARFVFDTDTGGAINGPGRVDLYMGEGSEMGRIAGPMKRHGKLFYVAPKLEFLQHLKSTAL